MNLAVHLALFTLVSLCIVSLTAFFAEADDHKAFGSLPRRLALFLVSCAGVGVLMLVCESVFASVS